MRTFRNWLKAVQAVFASTDTQPRFFGGEQVQFKTSLSEPLHAAAVLLQKQIGAPPYTVVMPITDKGEVLIHSASERATVLEEMLELVPAALAQQHPFHHIDETGRWAKNKCG